MGDSFEDLTARFVVETQEQAEQIARLLEAVASGDDPVPARAQIRELAHKIKGAAGIFGFEDLKLRASDLEVAAEGEPGLPLEQAVAALTAVLPS